MGTAIPEECVQKVGTGMYIHTYIHTYVHVHNIHIHGDFRVGMCICIYIHIHILTDFDF